MSDRVHELIETLRGKMNSLKDQYASERSKNDELAAINKGLNDELAMKSREVQSLQDEVKSLKEMNNAAVEQNVTRSEENEISDEQIDDLVKEIEYCIGQLKR